MEHTNKIKEITLLKSHFFQSYLISNIVKYIFESYYVHFRMQSYIKLTYKKKCSNSKRI